MKKTITSIYTDQQSRSVQAGSYLKGSGGNGFILRGQQVTQIRLAFAWLSMLDVLDGKERQIRTARLKTIVVLGELFFLFPPVSESFLATSVE
jgi:hypothetical protein